MRGRQAAARRPLFTAWDAALLAAVLLLGALLFWAAQQRGPGAQAVVERGGEVLYRIPLNTAEKTTYTVAGEYPLTIAVQNGEAWFEHAECPNQLCVRAGHLSRAGQTAACLPAGVVLRIEGTAAADAQTG